MPIQHCQNKILKWEEARDGGWVMQQIQSGQGGKYSLGFLHLWQSLSTIYSPIAAPELLTKHEMARGDEGLKKDR